MVVKRDTVAPTVTCASPPQTFEIYQLGAWVRADVTDATSGPASPFAQGTVMANTNTAGTFSQVVTGSDRAGLRTSRSCAYVVAIPTCFGQAATIVGTALNNVINGTAGRDVIVGLGGADTINGLGGDDLICGGDGPDVINGGDGADRIDGGASPDDLNGGRGDDFLDGGLQNDSLRGTTAATRASAARPAGAAARPDLLQRAQRGGQRRPPRRAAAGERPDVAARR